MEKDFWDKCANFVADRENITCVFIDFERSFGIDIEIIARRLFDPL